MNNMCSINPIEQLLIVVHSRKEVAEIAGVSVSAVGQWLSGKKQPSPLCAIKIESKTGFPKEKLRPDIDW